MNRIFLLMTILCCAQYSHAQVQKLNGTSAKPTVLNVSDKSRVDFFPCLIHLDQHPLPAAEYGTKKEELNRQRANHEANQNGSTQISEKKSRATAVNPTIFKGIQGNTSTSTPNEV